MAYSYGIRNTYRPSALAPNAYGWSSRPQYNRADVPTGLMDRPANLTSDQFLQQFAYEWFQSSQIPANYNSPTANVTGGANLTNPPFASGAAGRLHPLLRDSETGKPARILRGYIRRAEFSAGDQMTRARLYFMYNPEVITRDYVSYLNQDALDPFNTVYQSGNLVAPPSYMDFSFSLFFDRQEEATQPDHPGVFVDYQFFDLVVRNVVPSNPNQTGNTLPDNGVMMVNPRDITVVFSPQLSVQGRPLNATVNFERFTHRMTPTRMTITLQMRVVYMGPVKDQVEYRKEEFQAEAAIPIDEITSPDFGLSWNKNDSDSSALLASLDANGGALDTISLISDENMRSLLTQYTLTKDGNAKARLQALAWAYAHVVQGGPGTGGWTDYLGADSGSNRYNLPESADCSGLVTECYIRTGSGAAMNWSDHPGTAVILQRAQANPKRQILVSLDTYNWHTDLEPGDILIRNGHVAFFSKYDAGGNLITFDAAGPGASPEVGERRITGKASFTHMIRPLPLGSDSAVSTTSAWNSVMSGALNASSLLGVS
jgi:hypothetical protein